MYLQNIVLDLEFNGVRKERRAEGVKYEVIEIGAVRLDARGRRQDEFSCLIRPRLEEHVAREVTRLTGIRDGDLADAAGFSEEAASFAAWIREGLPDEGSDDAGASQALPSTRIVTWGPDDKRVFLTECAAYGIEPPVDLRRWMDIQRIYPRLMRIGRGGRSRMALRRASNWGGEDFDEGKAHRALYDAQATTELMAQLLDGSLADQRRAVQQAVRKPSEHVTLVSSLGDKYGDALAALRSQLAREAAAS